MSGTKTKSNSYPRRLTAMLGVALVLLLNALALRPDWHEAFHHEQASTVCAHAHQSGSHHQHDQGDSDDAHGCAVTLFAHGVSVQFDWATLPTVERVVEGIISRPRDAEWVAAVRHLRPPAQAPPSA
jgi:hypothetical protein